MKKKIVEVIKTYEYLGVHYAEIVTSQFGMEKIRVYKITKEELDKSLRKGWIR